MKPRIAITHLMLNIEIFCTFLFRQQNKKALARLQRTPGKVRYAYAINAHLVRPISFYKFLRCAI